MNGLRDQSLQPVHCMCIIYRSLYIARDPHHVDGDRYRFGRGEHLRKEEEVMGKLGKKRGLMVCILGHDGTVSILFDLVHFGQVFTALQRQ